MIHRTMFRLWAVLMLGVLAACGNQPTSAGTVPTAATQPTVAALSAPTAAGSQAPAAAPTAGAAQAGDAVAIPSGLTPEGYHMLGRPDAPVTLVMYSDFL